MKGVKQKTLKSVFIFAGATACLLVVAYFSRQYFVGSKYCGTFVPAEDRKKLAESLRFPTATSSSAVLNEVKDDKKAPLNPECQSALVLYEIAKRNSPEARKEYRELTDHHKKGTALYKEFEAVGYKKVADISGEYAQFERSEAQGVAGDLIFFDTTGAPQ